MKFLNIADEGEIVSGAVTDVYFSRTAEILRERGIRKRVRAEFTAKKLPRDWEWGILAGLDEALGLLDTLPVRARGLPEGAIFHAWDPVLEIEGFYEDFAVHETALLGLLCQASAIATQAARMRIAAGDRLLLSFGVRRMHPAIGPMIDRSAWIGGVDGISSILSAERLGVPPMGTMPHSLVLLLGDTVLATAAFSEVFPDVRLVSLIDTFNDEKFEAINVAGALGGKVKAMRLDTPGSRRGDFARLIKEVRWELDTRGHADVGLIVSGGLGEEELAKLRPLVEGFGVGTGLSASPTIDFSMDIVEIEGEPVAKRGKPSGAKEVFGCGDCLATAVAPLGGVPGGFCPCGSPYDLLTVNHGLGPIGRNGRGGADEARERVRKSLAKIALWG